MIKLAINEVIETARQIVAEEGEDFVYERRAHPSYGGAAVCLYVYEGQADCLAGRVLHRLGVPLDVMDKNHNSQIGSLLFILESEGIAEVMDGMVCVFLSELQGAQDSGHKWGTSLNSAEKWAEKWAEEWAEGWAEGWVEGWAERNNF